MATSKPTTPSETDQPALFSPEQFPTDDKLVEQAKVWTAHTGTTALKDMERCEAICKDLIMELGMRRTAKKHGVSHNTIRRIWEHLEKSGKLDTLKQRMIREAGYGIMLGLEAGNELITEGKMPPNVLPVWVGVLADKKAGWEGNLPASTVVEVRLTADNLLQRLEKLRQGTTPKPLTIDTQSDVSHEKAQ